MLDRQHSGLSSLLSTEGICFILLRLIKKNMAKGILTYVAIILVLVFNGFTIV